MHVRRVIYGGLASCLVLITFSPVVSGKPPKDGESLLMFTDPSVDFHWFPLDNPGLVTIRLSFILAIVGALTRRERADERTWAEMEVRALNGAGAEKASVIAH
jgi:cation/acetate symporter